MQRILVVDDDPSVTSVLKRGLAYEGFAVDTAASGVEGLTIARERPPDLVILDVMMPGLDGWEVLRRLRAADSQLPIVMLTAKDAPSDQVRGLESGADAGVPLRHERVELDRVVLEALGQARHLARGQRLEVAALEPAQVDGDPDRLKQLVLILLDNALKYTPREGSVSVGLRRNGMTVALEVHDTGIGISQEDLPRVFERFYRADPARRRDEGGTGLGLSIARWIAEQHGGDIKLSSEPGCGTRVLVSLPLAG